MRTRFTSTAAPFFCLVVATFATPMIASGEDSYGVFDGFNDGRWRTEVGVSTGFHSGNRSRTGDMLVTGHVEYGWPVFARCSPGLRAEMTRATRCGAVALAQSVVSIKTRANATAGLARRARASSGTRTTSKAIRPRWIFYSKRVSATSSGTTGTSRCRRRTSRTRA